MPGIAPPPDQESYTSAVSTGVLEKSRESMDNGFMTANVLLGDHGPGSQLGAEQGYTWYVL